MTGRYQLSCSQDQYTAWLSKPDTVLKFEMHDNIYRLRVDRVPGIMVMAALKQNMDSKKQMELLHQRFGHVGMETVKVLSNKLDVGVKMNAKSELVRVCCVCCRRMTHKRIPVRSCSCSS